MTRRRTVTVRARIVIMAVSVLLAGVGAALWARTVTTRDGAIGAADTIRLTYDSVAVDLGSINPDRVGEPFPDVTLRSLSGEPVELAAAPRPTVINIWYTTCGPCARELPAFGEAARAYGDTIRFVGVNPVDDVDRIIDFTSERGADYEQLQDMTLDLVDALALTWFPATYFVDADGTIIAQSDEITATELAALVNELTAPASATTEP